MAEKGIFLPGDSEATGEEEAPDLFLTAPGNVGVLKDTNLADRDAPIRHLRQDLAKLGDDLGDGFVIHHQPVRIERDIDGNIVRTTALTDIPGVEYTSEEMEKLTMVAEAKPKIKTLTRAERSKLLDVMIYKLMKYYANPVVMANMAKYNPVRDGLIDVPAGSPEWLSPLPGSQFYHATPGQVAVWLKGNIAPRVSVIEKNRFGPGFSDDVADLAVRIS